MTRKQIIKDYKSGIFHQRFAVFYCKELDQHLGLKFSHGNAENDLMLPRYKKNNVPPDENIISIK
jgi:hypothetical protein